MAEYSPFGPETEEDDDELETNSSSKSKKRASGLGASLLSREVKTDDKTEKPVPKSFGEALDMLLGNKKAEKEELAEKAKTVPWDSEEGVAKPVKAESSADEAPQLSVEPEQPPIRELHPNEAYGGEVVIDFKHPVEVQPPANVEVVPDETAENADEPTEEEVPIPEETAENADEETGEADSETDDDDDESTMPQASSAFGSGSGAAGGAGQSGAGSGGATGGGSGSSSTGSGTGAGGSSSSSSSGGGGSVPPVPPPVPPTPPIPPGSGGGPGSVAGGAGFNTAPPAIANIMPLPFPDPEEEYRRGHRRGFSRGLIGGLLLGGGIEHIRHKRRERRMERAHDKALEAKDKLMATEQEKQRIEERRRTDAEYWDGKKHARLAREAEQSQEVHLETERVRAQQTEQLAGEQAKELTSVEKARDDEHAQHVVAPVFVPSAREMTPEGAVKPAQAETESELVDSMDIPRNHRIEQSAWHNIEVDAHGNATQESQIQYGKEFRHERAQESLIRDEPHGVPSAAGEVALVANALAEEKHKDHMDRVKKSVGLAPEESRNKLRQANENSLSSSVKKALGPPTTPLATLVWFVAMLFIVFFATWILL